MSKYQLLIDKFIDRSISPGEREILEKWILESGSNMSFFKNSLKASRRNMSVDFDADLAYQRFLENLNSKRKASNPFGSIWKYAAVLAIIFGIGFLAKRQLLPNTSQTSIKVVENGTKTSFGNNIVFKMSDGTTQILNGKGDTTITDAIGNIVASKEENSLTFDEAREVSDRTPLYNEVFIPHGQTFRLKLSDGTLVWLNAGSKLRFPQSFANSDNKRIVYLEGEAYFDVAKNKNKPFIVNTQEVDIKVLGTKFNISSYDTDDDIVTTLIEGSVNVFETRTPENGINLTPSFQANYNKFGNNFKTEKVDTDIFTAWMQNRLVIDHLKFSEILVKLERKYSVKFVNNSESLDNEIYTGEFLDEDIESVLKTISLSTPFSYEVNQNIITITK